VQIIRYQQKNGTINLAVSKKERTFAHAFQKKAAKRETR
jgi:hypothetical protein